MRKSSRIYREDQSYEAILQLRPNDRELIVFVEKLIENKGNIFVTKIVKKKYGIDFYLNSRKFMRTLANQLKKRFEGELKVSKKIHTKDRMTSKEVYRITVCFRRKYPEDNTKTL